MIEEELLQIYIDGSSRNEKAGVVGIAIETNAQGEEIVTHLISQEFYNAKSSEAEILACIHALKEADISGRVAGKKEVIVYSDFQALVEGYQTLTYWVGKGLGAKVGGVISHRDQWKALARQREYYYQKYKIKVEVKKVPAHSNNIHNNLADAKAKELARSQGYQRPKPNLILSPNRFSKQHMPKSKSSGVLKMSGRDEFFRIRRCEYSEKKNWTYKYDFYSTQKHCWIESEHKIKSRSSLDEGKIYRVTVNNDNHRPEILSAVEIDEKEFSQTWQVLL